MASKNTETVELGLDDSELDHFAIVANELALADAAGEVIRQYFRKTFVIIDKEDLIKFSCNSETKLFIMNFNVNANLEQVKVPIYGCDCYAYALLATGFVDLVIEAGLKGAGGSPTDWKGHKLNWKASADSHAASFNVLAAGDKKLHLQALDALQRP